MKKAVKVLLCLALTGVILAGCGKEEKKDNNDNKETNITQTNKGDNDNQKDDNRNKENQTDASKALLTGKHHVEISIKDYGTIKAELDADMAPITVTNFVKLAKDGFYDGLTFHRIMNGFMMQGGDPLGNGTGGSGEDIKGEFAVNGVQNTFSHVRGALSMARSQNPDSASSQFFIVHQDSTFLDGQYAAFGYVTEGIEVVDAVCEAAKPVDGNGTIPPEQQPIIEHVKVID